MFFFDVDYEVGRFLSETYIKEFVHSFTDVLGEKQGGDVLIIKLKLLMKRLKLQCTHINKTFGQCKRPAGRERWGQPM